MVLTWSTHYLIPGIRYKDFTSYIRLVLAGRTTTLGYMSVAGVIN